MATSTTIQVSVETRDRLRVRANGRTVEEALVELLDEHDEVEFWQRADAEGDEYRTVSHAQRAAIDADHRAWDRVALVDLSKP